MNEKIKRHTLGKLRVYITPADKIEYVKKLYFKKFSRNLLMFI